MSTVIITVAGEDVTDRVIFATARFSSFVNGKPGEAYMRIRDLDQDYEVDIGADWLVTIDGGAAWRGFVTQSRRVYLAPAMNVTTPGTQRFVDLAGADLNILFSRRVVSNHADRANVEGTQFPAGTADITAITELLDNWLDIGGDDLDTTSGVDHVGDLDPEQKTRAWSGSWTWAQAMDTIAMLPAAIYYLRPETGSPKGTLVYCDVDQPSAPFGLSDQPNGTTTRGYREMEITEDGSSLANDVLAWGMGYGSQTPVFKRDRAPASIAEHGLWQTGKIVAGVYKQGTINRIAESIIDGSPSSKRGSKDDKPSVRLVTYVPGLLAGHVVEFTSEVWGWSDTIPVRQMTVTFEAPDNPRYELLLSHDIDAPWSFIDSFWPQIPGIPIYEYCPDPPCFPQPGDPNPPSACDCGVTDDFQREVTDGWGRSSSGYPWVLPQPDWTYDPTALLVTDGHGVAHDSAPFPYNEPWQALNYPGTWPFDAMFTLTIRTPTVVSGTTFDMSLYAYLVDGAGNLSDRYGSVEIHRSGTDTALTLEAIHVSGPGGGSGFTGSIPNGEWEDVVLLGHLRIEADRSMLNLWPVDEDEPSGWMTEDVRAASLAAGPIRFVPGLLGGGDGYSIELGQLAIAGMDACTMVNFDNFEREVFPGWGNATPSGYLWIAHPSGATNEDIEVFDNGDPQGFGGYIAVGNGSGPAVSGYVETVPLLFLSKTEWTVEGRFTNALDPELPASVFAIVANGGNIGLVLGGPDLVISDVEDEEHASVPFTWDLAATYRVKLHYVAGTIIEAKVWDETTEEPAAYMVYGVPVAVTDVDSTLLIGNVSTTSDNSSVFWMDISFAYQGAPCYYDCSNTALDDFARTETNTWGTATPSNIPWDASGSSYEVTGGVGIMRYFNGDSPAVSNALQAAYTTPGQMFLLRWLLHTDSDPLGEDVVVRFYAYNTVYTGLPDDTWRFTRMLVTETGIEWKTWVDGDPEPADYTDSEDGFLDEFKVEIRRTGDGYDFEIHLDYINLDGCVAVSSSPVSAPQSPSGFGCAVARRVSSTVYATDGPFIPNSTFVWRNGLLQRRGVDYTENIDNAGVTFTTAVDTDEAVVICYVGGVMP